jgi:hypothetical protein
VSGLELSSLDLELAICRLPPNAELPTALASQRQSTLIAITRTGEELSLVCAVDDAPAAAEVSRGWRALKVAGPLDFALTGVLASMAQPLAKAEISIFAISTFDTDYLLVKEADLDRAVEVLRAAGHTFRP